MRLASFWSGCCVSDNAIIRTCVSLQPAGQSVVDKNIKEIMCLLRMDPDRFSAMKLSCVKRRIFEGGDRFQPESAELIESTAQVIIELIKMLDGSIEGILVEGEVLQCLNELCMSPELPPDLFMSI